MMPGPGAQDPRARLDAWFDQALDLDPAAREALLADCERALPGAAAELRALLALAEDQDSQRLRPGRMTGAHWQAMFEARPPGAARETTHDAPLPPRIGVWRPVTVLGCGGMGTVYRVEREADGFRQTGALKRLRSGSDSQEFLQRFALERKILAELNHPGIARLLDGGRDDEGRPYLVMEYIEGEPIDVHCDRLALGIDARIALFLQVARAVAHAHGNLVAHRDLKPSNILVAADGTVKLLDFGIAKVLSDDGDGVRAATRTAVRMFTPEYATPEQVLGRPAAASADLYQLGLLLYELLTGHRAQQVDALTQRALEQAICIDLPVRPSDRIGAGDDDGKLARCAARASTPSALQRRLRGDLDNIVAMALRKEPERRYSSAQALIDDLERWRQHRPVSARPDTFMYVAGRFVRRHGWAVATSVAMLALIIAYAGTVTLQARTIARERDRAQAEATKAHQVQALVLRLLEGADPELSGGGRVTARELIDRGWAEIERELDGQPEVQVVLLDTVGEAYRKLGEYERARTLLQRALVLARGLEKTHPAALARARRSHARLLMEFGRYDEAEPQLRAALATFETLSPQDREARDAIADTLNDLASAHERSGRLDDAETLYRRTLAMRRDEHGDTHPSVADALGDIGRVLRHRGRHDEAVTLFEQALGINRKRLTGAYPELANSLSDLAWARSGRGEHAAAATLYAEALAVMREAVGDRHPGVALVMNNQAITLRDQGDVAQARTLLEQALAIRRDALGPRHEMVALNLNDLGQLHYQQDDHTAAERCFTEALAAYPPDHHWRGSTYYNLARLREAQARFADAEQGYREAIRIQSAFHGADHDLVGMGRNRLGVVLARQGRTREAEDSMRKALAIYRRRLPPGHERLTTVLKPLGELLLAEQRFDEAAPLLREGLDVSRRTLGDEDRKTRDFVALLARMPSERASASAPR